MARGPVLAAVVSVGVVLSASSGGYGYHRDELYFRMLRPAWGYVDQPPLAPLLARSSARLLADEPWALRLPATASAMACVLVLALVSREVGGGRAAQALCAWGAASASFVLVAGHVLLTATLDLPVWPAVLLCVLRAELDHRPRWWLVAGLVAGVSTYDKLLVAVLLVALAAGVLLAGPRRLVRSGWVWAAAAVVLVVAAPNLAYQAAHGWPQLSTGRALADHDAGSVRVAMWPLLAEVLGPPLVPVWIAGLVALVRRPAWRPVRFVAAAFPVVLLLVFLMGTQPHYTFGIVATLFALGCVPTAEWAQRVGRGALRPSRRRWRFVVVALVLNGAASAVLALPVVPVSLVGRTPVPAVNQVARDSIGWPTYVRQVAAVRAALPAGDRRRSVVIASNYGEAGAIARYGPRLGLASVYSGQNQLYLEGRPPASATVAVVVGGQVDLARSLFAACRTRARLDDGVGVDDEEQGQPVAVCRDPRGGWRAVWPALRHLD